MIDAAQWNLHGSVRSVRSEIAEWDTPRRIWKDRRFFRLVVFDADGRIVQLDQRGLHDSTYRTEHFYDAQGRPISERSGPAGEPPAFARRWTYDERGRETSIVIAHGNGPEKIWQQSTYDDHGRRTDRVTFPSAPENSAFSVKGSELGYGAPGAVNQITRYDGSGLPVEHEFFDPGGAIVRRVLMTRDPDGRVVVEEAETPSAAFPRQPGMSDDEFEAMQAALSTAAGSFRTLYEYDDSGRMTTRAMQMGRLAEDRTTYRYDDRGNVIGQTQLRTDRGMQVGEDGAVQMQPDTTRTHDTRFAHVYDGLGNWTEKVVSARYAEDGPFTPTNAEWRTIEYWRV